MATNTVPTFTNHTGNGTAGPFNIGFNFIDRNEVIVRVNEVLKSTPTHYTFNSGTQITFTSGNEPATGVNIELRRSTNITTAKVDFEDGSVLTETDLDANTNQLLFALQENTDAVNANNLESSSIYLRDGSRTLTGNIVFEGSTKDAHETTLTPVDPTADRTINIPNVSGTLVTTGDTGTVTSTMIANGTIVNVDIDSSAAIAGTKISPSFGSQNIFTTGNVTASSFIGDGSQLTGITFTGIDQFLRRDIDDDCLGKIRFGSDVTFKTAIVEGNTETSMNEIVWEAQAGKMTWDARAAAHTRGLHIEGDVPISHNSRGGNSDDLGGFIVDPRPGELEITQLLGQIKIKTAPYGLPRTVPAYTNHSNVVQWNSFAIQGTFSTDYSGDQGDYAPYDWLLLKQNTYSLSEIQSANGFDQEMYLRSNNTDILKVHKTGVDLVNGNLNAPDNGKFQFGDSQDLQIYHDGSHSVVKDAGTGQLKLLGSTIAIKNGNDNKLSASFSPNTACNLFYNNSKKFETTSTGTTTSGIALAGGIGTVGFKVPDSPSVTNETTTHGMFIAGTGDDLRISHSGTDSFITNVTGNLHIQPKASEEGIKLIPDGAVELYYDNSKKFETTSTGVTVTGDATFSGNLDLPDGSDILLGNDDDFRIYHDNSNGLNYIQAHNNGPLILKANSDNLAKFIPDGAVELYHDSSKKFETTSTGVLINGHINLPDQVSGTGKIKLGDNNDLQLYHDGTDSFIQNSTGGLKILGDTIRLKADSVDENMLVANANGAVELYHNNVKKAETSASGLDLPDNSKLQLGDSNDLTLHHDGAGSKIENSTGSLNINTVSSEIWFSKGTSEYLARFITDGAVELYFDGSKKFETTSSGSKITGSLGLNTDPDTPLHISANDAELLTIQRQGTQNGSIRFKNDTESMYCGITANATGFAIDNDANLGAGPMLFVDRSTGNVGIADSSPEEKLDVTGNVKVSGQIKLGDNNDLKLTFDGTNSNITNNTGILIIKSDEFRVRNNAGTEDYILMTADGAVKLTYDGVKQFETISQGAQIERAGTTRLNLTNTNTSGTGHVNLALRSFSADSDTKILFGTSADDNPGEIKYVSDTNKFAWRVNGTNTYQISDSSFNPTSDNSVSLGTSLKRFTTLHSVALNTGDINMNNLNHASGNEVDNTKGSWSLQEGADDLFIINRVSGKKYKFNLTEID